MPRTGFEPVSSPREGDMIGRTTPPGQGHAAGGIRTHKPRRALALKASAIPGYATAAFGMGKLSYSNFFFFVFFILIL